jgi:hypothetical protein
VEVEMEVTARPIFQQDQARARAARAKLNRYYNRRNRLRSRRCRKEQGTNKFKFTTLNDRIIMKRKCKNLHRNI